MEEAFIALLLQHAPIAAVVGNRIYWNGLPQTVVRPAAVMFVIDRAPNWTMTGQDGNVPGRIQIDAQALTYSAALALARLIKARLSGFKGEQSGVRFGGIFWLSERQSSEKPGTELIHRVSMDYQVWASA